MGVHNVPNSLINMNAWWQHESFFLLWYIQLKSIIIEDGKKDAKFIQETVSGILHMMENTTLPTKEMSVGDLNATLDILDMIVNITGPAIENKVTQL